MPVFMVEANYEFERDYEGPRTLRHQEYWAMLSGATGQLYGKLFHLDIATPWVTKAPSCIAKVARQLFHLDIARGVASGVGYDGHRSNLKC